MKKIATKMIEVMRECRHIAKNGTNSFHGYTYAMRGCSEQGRRCAGGAGACFTCCTRAYFAGGGKDGEGQHRASCDGEGEYHSD